MEILTLSKNSYIVTGSIADLIPYNYIQLWELHPIEKGKVLIYGKILDTPRYMQSYGSAYTFSHVKHAALPIPSLLQPFLDWANQQFGNKNLIYNTLFCNWYEDGSHYIGKHSDDEKTHIVGSPIISISLGATRIFRIRDRHTHIIIKDIPVVDQSYIVMCGAMQKEFTHEIPKINGKKAKLCGSRINITIRAFKET